MLANVRDYLCNRLLEWFATPRCRHDTKIAAMNTPARRFKNVIGEVMRAWQQLAACERTVRQIQPRRLRVTVLQLAGHEVPEQLRPRVLGVSHDDRIRMRGGIFRNQCYVRASQ